MIPEDTNGYEREWPEVVGAEQPSTHNPGTLSERLGELQMEKGPWDPKKLATPISLVALESREFKALIYDKMRQNPTNLEGMVKYSSEETFMNTFKRALADVDHKKKHGMKVLMQNVVFDVKKGDWIQEFICRFSAKVVNKEDVLDSLGKRQSATLFDKNEIMAVLVESPQQKADIVISSSVYHTHERINKAAEENSTRRGGVLEYHPQIREKGRRNSSTSKAKKKFGSRLIRDQTIFCHRRTPRPTETISSRNNAGSVTRSPSITRRTSRIMDLHIMVISIEMKIN